MIGCNTRRKRLDGPVIINGGGYRLWEVLLMDNKIETMSTVRIQKSDDLYKIVDTLNRTLKEKNLMFGLALDDDDAETAVFTIYRT